MLSWGPPQESNGVIIAYEVTFNVYGNVSVMNTTNVSTTSTLQLAPSTRVSDISVRAYTSVGPGSIATHPDVSTLRESLNLKHLTAQYAVQSLTAMVVNVEVEAVSDDSVKVSWDSVNLPEITGYTIYYSWTGNTRKSQVPQSVHFTIIDSLATNVVYQFQVSAIAELNGKVIEGQRSTISGMSKLILSPEPGKWLQLKEGVSLQPASYR